MATSPDDNLREIWADIARPDSRWEPFTGGNTNALWQVENVVIKRFTPGGETPLFANDPAAEGKALGALRGTGLAPDLIEVRGESLAYHHVQGEPWTNAHGVICVARALSALHQTPPPPGLPRAKMGADHLATQTRALGGHVEILPSLAKINPVFLHGDATASNALVTKKGVTFIDWQCPAVGDPCDDMAVFLSPAMQVISGNAPLVAHEVETFLDAYGDAKVTDRYRRLAPLYAARMAAYCNWRAARGDAGYAQAAKAELTTNL